MQRFTSLFGLVMSIVFIFMGIFIQIYPPPAFSSPLMKHGLGIILLLYGAFRLYRSYKILNQK